MSPERAVLAIDLGTTQAKAGLVSLDGRLLAIARASYAINSNHETGAAEQDPADWWQAIVRMTADVLVTAESVAVQAICVDGHGPTLVATDDAGRPVHPAITWLDRRSAAEEEALTTATGDRDFALGILPKALWLQRHGGVPAADARWYLATWEWIALRLSGYAMETRLPGRQNVDRQRAAATGLHVERIPEGVASGSIVGPLLDGPARELGLAKGIPVIAGMADAHASFIGAGLLDPGDAIDTGGTSGGFAVYTDRPIDVPGAFQAAAPIPGRWFLGGAMSATGKAFDWLRDDVLGGSVGTAELLAEAAAAPPGADGLVFLPYLSGERSPIWDPRARGAFVGLTLRHRRGHLARAVLEAAALAIRHVAAPVVAAGVLVRELRVSSGFGRERVWNEVRADVTGFTVAVPAVGETAMFGSAIVAAASVGAYPDLPTAIRAMVRIVDRIEPAPERRRVYDAIYATYAELYPALRSAFHQLSDIESGHRTMTETKREGKTPGH